ASWGHRQREWNSTPSLRNAAFGLAEKVVNDIQRMSWSLHSASSDEASEASGKHGGIPATIFWSWVEDSGRQARHLSLGTAPCQQVVTHFCIRANFCAWAPRGGCSRRQVLRCAVIVRFEPPGRRTSIRNTVRICRLPSFRA